MSTETPYFRTKSTLEAWTPVREIQYASTTTDEVLGGGVVYILGSPFWPNTPKSLRRLLLPGIYSVVATRIDPGTGLWEEGTIMEEKFAFNPGHAANKAEKLDRTNRIAKGYPLC